MRTTVAATTGSRSQGQAKAAWNYEYVHEYLTTLRRAATFFREHPDGELKVSWDRIVTREEWERDRQRALDRRINLKGGVGGVGRKWDADYQRNLFRDCQTIHDYVQRRVVRSGLNVIATPELRRRVPHVVDAMEGELRERMGLLVDRVAGRLSGARGR